MVGGQVEAFHCGQAEAALSAKVIPIKAVPRLYVSMDGTGVPVVKRETSYRRGKDGGQAKTREAKLGCIFTQTTIDKDGRRCSFQKIPDRSSHPQFSLYT